MCDIKKKKHFVTLNIRLFDPTYKLTHSYLLLLLLYVCAIGPVNPIISTEPRLVPRPRPSLSPCIYIYYEVCESLPYL